MGIKPPKMFTNRIDPVHYNALNYYLNSYFNKNRWSFTHPSNDLFYHLTATKPVLDIAHAFCKGRESMADQMGG